MKKVTSVILALLIALFSTVPVLATDTDAEETVVDGWVADEYEHLAPEQTETELGLPAYYDTRNLNILTSVKDQGVSYLCWMYAGIGAVESLVSLKYGTKIDLSEAHGAVAMSNSIGSADSGYYTKSANVGGNNGKFLQYFTNWNTPVFSSTASQWKSVVEDSDYPFEKVDLENATLIDDSFTDADSFVNVTSAHYLTIHDIYSLKRAIMDYGSIVTGLCTYSSNQLSTFGLDENGEYNYFRSSNSTGLEDSPTHAIMIVGWDDNYSKENFSSDNQPTADGAWLVKNSYEEKGYFWLSYQEGSLKHSDNSIAVITGVQKANSNEYMLSYDYFNAYADTSVYFRDDVYLCNVFDVSDYTDEYDQINKVMIYLRTTGCTYDIKIVQLDSNGNLPTSLDNCASLATGTYSGEGYITANLESSYNFVSNNKCAVIVKLSPTTSTSKVYIPYEGQYRASVTTTVVPEINNGESYYYILDEDDGGISWNDANEYTDYSTYSKKGNFIIRPILSKSSTATENITITPNEVLDTDSDVDIAIDSNVALFSVHTSSNYILRQDTDYVRTDTGITLKDSYIDSLNGTYTELVLEFNNDTTRTVVVNPKATITSVTISGSPIVGDTLTATCVGSPEKAEYDVNYQWQTSTNGTTWYDIAYATSSSYTVTDNELDRYIRVKVTSNLYGNVVYPTEEYSSSTECKVVILGDVDLNGIVSITDCTLLQKYIAGIVQLNAEQLLAADANRDGIANIKDVTEIQKMYTS